MDKTARILVVDDESSIRELYAEILRDEGHEVWEASTGIEGLRLTRERRPDLVLLDVMLPDVNGMEICQHIKAEPGLVDVFVVLFSGEATSGAHKIHGAQTGADDYLVKPIGWEDFLARIRTMIRLRNTTVALRASEQHYRHLVEILPDAVGLFSPEGRLLVVNPQGVTMLGYESTRELVGKSLFELAPPEEHERIRRDLAVAVSSGSIRNVQYTLLRQNGQRLPVELSARVLRETAKEPAKLVGIIRDISRRKRAEEQIRLLADAVESAQEIITITDQENRIHFANQAFLRAYGYSKAEVLGAKPQLLYSSKNPPGLQEQIYQQTLQGGWRGELWNKRRDGSEFPISLTTSQIKNSDGKILGLVGVARDISERRRVAEALEQSRRLQRAILDNIPDPAWLKDAQGRFLACNEMLAKTIGKSAEEIVGKTVSELGVANAERLTEEDQKVMRLRRPLLFESQRTDAQGRLRWFDIIKSPLLGESGESAALVGIARDVTERRRFEEELQRLPRRIIEAQEAERMRVARELHDGVNQLLASAQMRLRRVQDSVPEFRPAIREILVRCGDLLVQALEENRRIAYNLRPGDLDELGLEASCRHWCQEFHARTNVVVKCEISQLEGRLTPALELNLFRIVQEAFNNVEKHARAKTVQLRLARAGEWIELEVQDDGCGFTPKLARAGRGKKGGIGLNNIRERAVAIGASCEIKSAPTQGTTIIIRAPCKGSA